MPATRRMLLRCALGGAALTLVPAIAAPAKPTAAESRIALVIGNGAYRSAPLKNPPRDAAAVADALRGLGYDVALRQNTRLAELIESLRDFSVRASKASVRVLFYAGHGVQVKGRNYLVPIDADPQSEQEVQRQAADIAEVVDRLSAIRTGINVVVLDACRVNPFAAGVVVGPDGRRLKFRGATPGGLAPLDAPVGTLVAFSTAPNGVALDGAGGDHSVYTRHLLANLPTPGLQIEQLFKRVRIGVAEDTGRVQVPWESSSLTSSFCFKSDEQGRCG